MSCDPERVTGLVDGELDAEAAAAVTAHLEACAACRAQAEAERGLRARLRGLPVPALPEGLEARVRAGTRRRPLTPGAVARWALPLAAVLVAGFWVRGHVPFVAWDLARDHDKCFSRRPLPAKVWSGEPRVVAEWFEAQGTRLPGLPDRVGELALVGARYCPLVGLSWAPHVYYESPASHVSVFVVPHGVRLADRFAGEARGDAVRLLRVGGEVVGIVGEREGEVQAVESALRPVLAAWASSHRGGQTSSRE
ncbi:MAG TPA: zf-HC2 domain-containing protein [Vicinamibacteria bacterium]|nr:zf-HC2 domain-containing protein [Vicinamibacteria bacterium]